jgi:hypothetical protein
MTYDKEILKLKRKIALLETRAAKAVERRKLTALRKVTAFLKKLGYPSLAALTADLGSPKVTLVPKGKKRATITDSIRKGVIADLKAGKKAAAVSKKHGISLPSVNNIKKAAGLTKSKKAAPKPIVKKASKPKKKTKKASPKAEVITPATNSAPSLSPGNN